MKSKLGIDFDKVGHAREMARKIADQVQDFVDGYTTVAVERTLCRLLGIDGVDVHEMTQKEVADLLGISQSYISRLEKKIMKRLKKEIVRFE